MHAAVLQQERVAQWLFEPERRTQHTRMPLDQGAALCEAHFLFICWDSVRKAIDHVRQNAYGLVTPREVLRRNGQRLEHYSEARDHLEHLTERYPGKVRSDWRGDANSITGSVAGISRSGQFHFQGEEWDVTEGSVVLLRDMVTDFVNGVAAELQDRLEAYHRGESAVRRR